MKVIFINDPYKKIEGVLVKRASVCRYNVEFERYYTNEYGVYLSERLASDIFFDDPAFDIHMSKRDIKKARAKALWELAKKIYPEINTLYVDF